VLRQTIQKILESSKGADAEQVALKICIALEDELDLEGNGWWDDDPLVLKALEIRSF
jgi:hypothetical protein